MSNWRGSILTGQVGSAFVEKLALAADAQLLARTNEVTGRSFQFCRPWMSHAAKRGEWAHLHREPDAPMVPSSAELSALSRAFNFNGPLRAIDPTNWDREVNFDHSEESAIFRARLENYFNNLREIEPDYDVRICRLVSEVIPLRKLTREIPVRFDGEGMTTQCYRGGVFLTLAKNSEHNACEDLLNFIHECGHQAFNLLLCSDDILAENMYTPSYSPVRKTFRPGILAVHALVAVAYMVELLARAPELMLRDSSPAWVKLRFSGLLEDLGYGIASVKGLALTDVGKALISEFQALHDFAKQRQRLYAEA